MSLSLSTNTASIDVLIICTEMPRYKLWAERLLRVAGVRVYVRHAEGWYLAKDEGGGLEFDEDAQLSAQVALTLAHQGDSQLVDDQARMGRIFWFSAPGTPEVPAGDLAIRRATAENNFEITVEDAQEIVDYSRGVRAELPQCCLPKPVVQYVPALSILCQGYLMVHADPETGQPDLELAHPSYQACSQALQMMKWPELLGDSFQGKAAIPEVLKDGAARRELQTTVNAASWWQVCAFDQLLEGTRQEWGAAEGWLAVGELLDAVRNDQLLPAVVARAYCNIFEWLGGQA